MKSFSAMLALVLITISASVLTARAQTVQIDIIGRQYVPPARTPKIPQDFKDRGARFVVRAGDVIKICNADVVFAKPTSLSKGNSFRDVTGPGGLRPGDCMTLRAQNPGNKPIPFWLHDDIHTGARLLVVVVPANWPNEGEETTPSAPGDQKGVVTDKNIKSKPCTADQSSLFSKMLGAWKSYALKLTVKGSCDQISGSMEWVEWCSPVDDKTNGYQHYAGTFTGEMNSSSISLTWSIPKMGLHDAQEKTGSISLLANGNIKAGGFGCGNGELKKE